MAEPFDVYADGLTISTNPWGTNLVFGLSPAAASPESNEEATHLGTIRVSNEYLKILGFAICRSLMQHEKNVGAQLGIPVQVLDELGIPKDDWDSFWAQTRG